MHATQCTAKTRWENHLAGLWPCWKGPLAKVHKPCIRPDCRVGREGAKHPAWLLSYSQNGKRRCLDVALGRVKTMQQALKNGRRREKLLSKMGSALLRDYREPLKTQPYASLER